MEEIENSTEETEEKAESVAQNAATETAGTGETTDTATVETGNAAVTEKEEILKRSRAENKNGDEREAQFYKNALAIAYSVGLLVMSVIIFLNLALADRSSPEIISIYTAMGGTVGIFMGVKTERRKIKAFWLMSGILCLIGGVGLFVIWVLQLCGVMV